MARTLHPQGHHRFQVVFLRLLRECGYPDIEALESDMRRGFPLLGELRHTPGWRPRLDEAYAHPISIEAFKKLNGEYVRDRMLQDRLDPEWRRMLQEVLQEVQAGRMEGPFQSLDHWPRRTVGLVWCRPGRMGSARCVVARTIAACATTRPYRPGIVQNMTTSRSMWRRSVTPVGWA